VWGGAARFEARIRELVEGFPDLAILIEPLLVVRRVKRLFHLVLESHGGRAYAPIPERSMRPRVTPMPRRWIV
jgi:hypothetical protein